ncbi:MAG: beta-propeller domain-containing protein [Acidimicrobiia bacterium]|nr:beta-propeller domain-containing protein [Acidimicrobiia bacterium]
MTRRRIRTATSLLAAVAVGAAGLACTDSTWVERSNVQRAEGWPDADVASLAAYDDCRGLEGVIHEHALADIGPWGVGSERFEAVADVMMDFDDGMAFEEVGDAVAASPQMDSASRSAESAPVTTTAPVIGGDGEFSDTNVQEAGVDEPDVVKTDGSRLVTVVDGTLRIMDLTTPVPAEVGSLALDGGHGHRLFLDGDRAVVLSSDSVARPQVGPDAGRRGRSPEWSGPGTRVSVIDVADPAAPTVVQAYVLDGSLSAARRVGDQVRLVTTADPQPVAFTYPDGSGRGAELRAVEANRDAVAATSAEDWLPQVRTVDERGRHGDAEPLVACDSIGVPVEFAGFGSVVVSTLDIGDAQLDAGASVGVMAGDATVYASAQNLYVATTEWMSFDESVTDEWSPGASATGIHMFSITGGEPAAYLASGQVEGRLLNQFAMSEHAGHLRVATTLDPDFGGRFMPVPDPMPMPVEPELGLDDVAGGGRASSSDDAAGSPGRRMLSDNALHVLARDGANLVEVGYVDGMGIDERIYSVRYLGDMGYIVTFRETDPLYTIDLSDPTDPRVLGELKIPGFSTYLHPTHPGRLVGIGQDATETGMPIGLQVSVFDVADPTDPQRTALWTLPDATSSAEGEHHAFLWWQAENLLAVPVSSWGDGFEGVIVLDVTDTSITERGRIEHLPGDEAATPCDVPGCPGVDPEPTTTTSEPPETTTTTVDDPTTTTTIPAPGQEPGPGPGPGPTVTTEPPATPPVTGSEPSPATTVPESQRGAGTESTPPPPSGRVPLDDLVVDELAVDPGFEDQFDVIEPFEPLPFEPTPPGGGRSWAVPIARVLVVGDTLITVSEAGVKVSGLGDLATRAWLPFA